MRRKPNVLLLDEPTNHLDIASREALEDSLADFEGTVLAISHDRYFVNRLASRVWELEDGRLTTYLGDYEAYREKKLDLQARTANEARLEEGAKRNGNKNGSGSRISRKSGERGAGKSIGTLEVSDKTGEVGGNSRTRDHESVEKLEQAMARMEVQMQELDQRLEALENDPEALEQTWNERERLSAAYDELLAQWAEM